MRVALIADVHGNLVALQTVLEALERENIEMIVCLGDIAEVGPQPAEVIECLRSLGCPIVLGNTDAHLAARLARAEPATGPQRRLVEIDRWTIEQVADEHIDFLGSLPQTVSVDLGGDRAMLCYHGSPRSNTERIEPDTPEAELAEMLAGTEELVMAGGHTHHQMVRRWGRGLVVNPGSVGLALTRPGTGSVLSRLLDEAASPVFAAHAEYAILSAAHRHLDVDFRQTAFDPHEVLAAAVDCSMPHLGWWAAKWTGLATQRWDDPP